MQALIRGDSAVSRVSEVEDLAVTIINPKRSETKTFETRPTTSLKRLSPTVNPIKLETGLRPNSAGIPYTLLLWIEASGFPTFWLRLYTVGNAAP